MIACSRSTFPGYIGKAIEISYPESQSSLRSDVCFVMKQVLDDFLWKRGVEVETGCLKENVCVYVCVST